MAYRASCVAVLLSILPIAGCGTVANLVITHPAEGGRSPFGGVRQDVSCIQKAENGEFSFTTHPKSESESEPHPQIAPMLLCAADLPFSLIGDIVTWPYTAAYVCINQTIPPVAQAPAQLPQVLPGHPAQQMLPPIQPESDTLPPPRPVEPTVPQEGVMLLPVDSPACACGGPK